MSILSSFYSGRKSVHAPFPTEEYVISLYESEKYIDVAASLSVLMKLHDDWMDGLDDEGYQTENFGDYHDLLDQTVSEDLPKGIFENIYNRALMEENAEFFGDLFGPSGIKSNFFRRRSSVIYELKDSILGLLFNYIFDHENPTDESVIFVRKIIPFIIKGVPELNYSDVYKAVESSQKEIGRHVIEESPKKMNFLEKSIISLAESIGNVNENDDDQMMSASYLISNMLLYDVSEAFDELERRGAKVNYKRIPKKPLRKTPQRFIHKSSPVLSSPKSLSKSPVRSPVQSLSKSPVRSPPKSPVQSELGSFYGGRKTLQDPPAFDLDYHLDIIHKINERAENQDYKGINKILNELLRLSWYNPGIYESAPKLDQVVHPDFAKGISNSLSAAIKGSYIHWYEFNEYMLMNMDPILNIPYRRNIFAIWVCRWRHFHDGPIPNEMVLSVKVTYSALPYIYQGQTPTGMFYVIQDSDKIQDKMALLIERIDDDLIYDPEEYEAAQEKMSSYIRFGYYRTAKNLYDKGIRLTAKEAEELRNLILENDQLEFLRD